jgi:serine beta-lactamase-like protein LACTB
MKFCCVRLYRNLHNITSDGFKKNSCSKCLTMAVLARLWEEGRVELDQSVSHYLPTWPDKLVDGQPVNITLRQLCSHLGGIRYK